MSGQYYEFHQVLIFMIFGRTDLGKGVSGAKFDGQADFEVRLAVAPQNPSQNSKKLYNILKTNQKFSFRFFGVFSASKGRRRLKLSQLIDLDVPDSFFRADRGQRDGKTSNT